ncbi:MAG: hypothetical protein K0R18_1290 [Bacillales bacterium]|jgi:hypothetical protein|nr:hypothetical protein [Bacillales bacterium]
MHEALEAYYVTNELADGICKAKPSWDFGVLLYSYMLYYQSIEISEKRKSLRVVVKKRYLHDANKIFKISNNTTCFDFNTDVAIFEMFYDSIEDMIEHLLLIPSELEKWNKANRTMIYKELGLEDDK